MTRCYEYSAPFWFLQMTSLVLEVHCSVESCSSETMFVLFFKIIVVRGVLEHVRLVMSSEREDSLRAWEEIVKQIVSVFYARVRLCMYVFEPVGNE